ncbi:hypothetical protein [Paenibacillus sp. NEAU-GSW1]|nr:hypothetical protein [Paenibacillus sp. NEAU-GSW1]
MTRKTLSSKASFFFGGNAGCGSVDLMLERMATDGTSTNYGWE